MNSTKVNCGYKQCRNMIMTIIPITYVLKDSKFVKDFHKSFDDVTKVFDYIIWFSKFNWWNLILYRLTYINNHLFFIMYDWKAQKLIILVSHANILKKKFELYNKYTTRDIIILCKIWLILRVRIILSLSTLSKTTT